MKFKLLNESGEKTFALIFEKGDEVIGELKQFATEQHLLASHFTAMEVLSLAGDVTIEGDMPKIHAHVVVGKSDGTAHGGHLMEGYVFPTLELILVESPKFLKRKFDPEIGFALIDVEGS